MSIRSETDERVVAVDIVFDVVVVGAGFNGLYQLRRLRELDFNVVLIDSGSGPGGVWNINRYPGARTDSSGPVYQFSDEDLWRGWEFSELFPGHEEVRSYFEYVESKLDLKKDCRYATTLVSAEFDESSRTWALGTDSGDFLSTRILIMATGSTVRPYEPPFPRVEAFQGVVVHSARWPEGGLDYEGKKVAVVGTGASGLQLVQEIGPVAERLTVFQRTPNLSPPMQQRELTSADNVELKKNYPKMFDYIRKSYGGNDFDFDPRKAVEVTEEAREELLGKLWVAGGFRYYLGTFSDMLFDETANRYVYDFWKMKIREIVEDPVKAELLAPEEPPHAFGTKRPALHQNYYEVMNQDNVSIVSVRDNPIVSFTETGILVQDGTEHEFDIVVLATGFDTNTGALTAVDIRGTDGRTLREKWEGGVDAYLGATTHGYPNLLFLYGPQSPAGFANGPAAAEQQGDLVLEFLTFLRRGGHTRFESTVEADEAWTAKIAQADAEALFRDTDSWYNGGNIPGKHKQMLQWISGIPRYREHWNIEMSTNYSMGFAIE